MNKKRIIVSSILSFATALIAFLLVFLLQVKYSGNFLIEYSSNSTYSDIILKAKTPFGREIEFKFDNNKTVMSGFYKSAQIEFKNKESCTITIERNKNIFKYEINDDVFPIPIEKNYKINFFTNFLAFTSWILGIKIIQDILIFLGFGLILLLAFYIFKRLKKKKLKGERIGKNLLASIYVFFAGIIFWAILLMIVFEISLRIFGSFYEQKSFLDKLSNEDPTYTILCIGDSFTYGIGAHEDKSYPNQLKEIIKTNENITVRTINAGVCAGNSTQMLENIQLLLNTHQPDLVIMLFGMANSWNYYGFSKTDSFLHRIKLYKLYKRIAHNIAYKKHGFVMWQRVNNFANAILIKSIQSIINKGLGFDAGYYAGRYYIAHQKWGKAIDYLAFASSKTSENDSLRNAIWVSIEGIDTKNYFNNNYTSPVETTIVDETVNKIDSLINIYQNAVDLKIAKYRYFITKTDTTNGINFLIKLIKENPDLVVPYFDLLKYDLNGEYTDLLNLSNNEIIKILNNIHINNFNEVHSILNIVNPNNLKIQIIKFVFENIDIFNNYDQNISSSEYKQLINKLLEIIDKNQVINTSKSIYKQIAELILNEFKSKYTNTSKHQIILQIILMIFELEEHIHEAFSLTHTNKRSLNLKDQEVFNWIQTDIDIITDICIKQSYPLICMNYPIIPPPNSEEISYWASNVGEIWKKTAKRKSIIFVDNDSIFSLYGEEKYKLFEPAFTGSEHCNELGYALMAENIYKAIKKNNLLRN